MEDLHLVLVVLLTSGIHLFPRIQEEIVLRNLHDKSRNAGHRTVVPGLNGVESDWIHPMNYGTPLAIGSPRGNGDTIWHDTEVLNHSSADIEALLGQGLVTT